MSVYTITISLGASRMLDSCPERGYTITLIADDDERAISHAKVRANDAYNARFAGLPILKKFRNVAEIRYGDPDLHEWELAEMIAWLKWNDKDDDYDEFTLEEAQSAITDINLASETVDPVEAALLAIRQRSDKLYKDAIVSGKNVRYNTASNYKQQAMGLEWAANLIEAAIHPEIDK